jgi:hydrogenase nickel incorporation protein HypA/HybF
MSGYGKSIHGTVVWNCKGCTRKMHEYPITQRIIEIAWEYAKENQAEEIKVIHLVVGDYCGYVASSIELYFGLIAEGTPCEHAELHIERVIPKLRCKSCGELFVRKPFHFECPICNSDGEPTQIGQEFFIKSIEI